MCQHGNYLINPQNSSPSCLIRIYNKITGQKCQECNAFGVTFGTTTNISNNTAKIHNKISQFWLMLTLIFNLLPKMYVFHSIGGHNKRLNMICHQCQ